MKKYRHLKTDKVVIEKSGEYLHESSHSFIPRWIVENSSDWELIDEYKDLVERLRKYQKECEDFNYSTILKKAVIHDIENIINGK